MGGEVERLYAARAADLTPDAQQLLLLAATADTADLDLRPRRQRGAGHRRREPAGGRGERADRCRARGRRVQASAGALGDLPAVDVPGAPARASGDGRPARRRGERRPACAGTWSGPPPDRTTSSPTCSRPPRTGRWPAADPRRPSTGGSGPPSSAAPTPIAPDGCSVPPRSPCKRASRSAPGSCSPRRSPLLVGCARSGTAAGPARRDRDAARLARGRLPPAPGGGARPGGRGPGRGAGLAGPGR